MSELERAIAFATEAHAGQVDKLGEPYIDHCLRVMGAVSEPAKRVAVLHDVVEDTALSVQEVSTIVGLSNNEWAALEILDRGSHGPGAYADYIERLATTAGPHGAHAREVKVADLRDNLGRWVPAPVGGTVFDDCSHCAGRLSSVPSKAVPARPEFWDRFIDKPQPATDRRGNA